MKCVHIAGDSFEGAKGSGNEARGVEGSSDDRPRAPCPTRAEGRGRRTTIASSACCERSSMDANRSLAVRLRAVSPERRRAPRHCGGTLGRAGRAHGPRGLAKMVHSNARPGGSQSPSDQRGPPLALRAL
ncbi:hypothetical protein C8Q77DRAFT_285252 [Trametes polyzona]|nr:hypothetical protein C8Q77DRAFT_285252 [Trametes polyzona]